MAGVVTDSHVVHGQVYAPAGRPLDPDDVRRHLRERGVLAAVATRPRDALAEAVAARTGSSDDVLLAIATDEQGRAVVVRDGRPEPGPVAHGLAGELAGRFGTDVELGDAHASGTPQVPRVLLGAADDAPVDEAPDGLAWVDLPEPTTSSVLACRVAPEYLPSLAWAMKTPLRVLEADGWKVLVPDGEADSEKYAWSRRDLPVYSLARYDESRSITAPLAGMRTPPVFLTPTLAWAGTFEPDEVPAAAEALQHLTDPETRPDSAVEQLARVVPDVDRARLRAALASPEDAHWFARVTEALGLPPLVAAAAEGSVDLAGASHVQPAGRSLLLQSLDLYVDEGLAQGTAARGLRRWYAGIVRRPALMLLTAVPEVALAAAGLGWAATSGGGFRRALAVVAAAALLSDAVLDVVLISRARRRHPGLR